MDSRHYNNEKLKQLRESRNLTQKQVAEVIGRDRQTVFRAESGQSASYELLCAFAQVYSVDVVAFLYRQPLAKAA